MSSLVISYSVSHIPGDLRSTYIRRALPFAGEWLWGDDRQSIWVSSEDRVMDQQLAEECGVVTSYIQDTKSVQCRAFHSSLLEMNCVQSFSPLWEYSCWCALTWPASPSVGSPNYHVGGLYYEIKVRLVRAQCRIHDQQKSYRATHLASQERQMRQRCCENSQVGETGVVEIEGPVRYCFWVYNRVSFPETGVTRPYFWRV